MKDLDKHTCRIALVQAEPVLFNKQESLKKALGYIEEAAKNKAELDMDLPAACKMEHDATGHYARPDVLQPVVSER